MTLFVNFCNKVPFSLMTSHLRLEAGLFYGQLGAIFRPHSPIQIHVVYIFPQFMKKNPPKWNFKNIYLFFCCLDLWLLLAIAIHILYHITEYECHLINKFGSVQDLYVVILKHCRFSAHCAIFPQLRKCSPLEMTRPLSKKGLIGYYVWWSDWCIRGWG